MRSDQIEISRLKVSSTVRWFVSSTGVVVLSLESGRYYSFNEVGSSIWLVLAEGRSTCEIEASVKKTHAVSDSRLRRDLSFFLEQLVQLRLVEPFGACE
ncbi:MAG: PqqD family protein [Bryobacterales bacterium]|nr:PqqD family protein [Bryobacterales bacterium]